MDEVLSHDEQTLIEDYRNFRSAVKDACLNRRIPFPSSLNDDCRIAYCPSDEAAADESLVRKVVEPLMHTARPRKG